jgi:hypothetical protein
MWKRIAGWFDLKAERFNGEVRPLEWQMAGDAAVWRDIVERQGLAEANIDCLISPWHTDADPSLGANAEMTTTASASPG